MTKPERGSDAGLGENIPLNGAQLVLYKDIQLREKTAILQRLIRDIAWRQEHITLFGKRHPQPRLIAWHGDPNASYRYSGLDNTPADWTQDLQYLRERVQDSCGHQFNSVLLNYYRDGSDAMGQHADDELELGPEPVIASLSLGATRRLRFTHRQRQLDSLALDLVHGSLLLMAGATQRNWKHGISRTRRPCGPRVNLTFRQILSPQDPR